MGMSGRTTTFAVGALLLAMLAVGCSESSVAGTIIETNTGNKVLIETNTGNGFARVMVSVTDFKISEGDTLQISRTLRDTVSDTVFASTEYLEKVATEANIAAGHVSMDSVPAQDYDSLTILPAKGGARSFAIDLNAEEGETYRISDKGTTNLTVSTTLRTHSSDYPVDSSEMKIEHVFFDAKSFGTNTFLKCKYEEFRNDSLIIYDASFGHNADSSEYALGILDFEWKMAGGQICDSAVVSNGDGDERTIYVHFELGNCAAYYVDSTGAKCVETSHKEITEGNASAYFDLRPFDRKIGDTIKVSVPVARSLKNDTIYSTLSVVNHVLDSADVANGLVKVNALPEIPKGYWAVDITDEGMFWSNFALDDEETTFVFVGKYESNGYTKVIPLTVSLPEGFGDLSSADESFRDMPLPIRLEKPATKACLVDPLGRIVSLRKSEGDSLLYWGSLMEVVFSENGSLTFDLLNNCYYEDWGKLVGDTTVVLSRHTESFDNLPASQNEGALGNALWTDSTDKWILINDFEPFTNDGTQMSASIWIKADSASQATPGKSYTRILSAKKDSVAFILQQRGNQAAVNLRLDARHDGEGVYNTTYGTARILDGEWHNYSFTIRGDSVFTYVDGVTLSKDQFENGGDFSTCTNPAVGGDSPNLVGGLDEVFFFDGSQSENWMRLFYALQAQAR